MITRRNPWHEFAELLEALAAEGSLERKNTIKALEQLADSFEDEADRTMYRGELGLALGRIGNFAEADRILSLAEYAQEKANYWLRLAEQQFQAGERDGALNSLRRSEEAIDSLRAEYLAERAEVLAHKAKLLEDFGLADKALDVWNKAIRLAQDGQEANPNSSDCSAVLVNVTRLLTELGHTEMARSVADSITTRFPSRREHAHRLIGAVALGRTSNSGWPVVGHSDFQ